MLLILIEWKEPAGKFTKVAACKAQALELFPNQAINNVSQDCHQQWIDRGGNWLSSPSYSNFLKELSQSVHLLRGGANNEVETWDTLFSDEGIYLIVELLRHSCTRVNIWKFPVSGCTLTFDPSKHRQDAFDDRLVRGVMGGPPFKHIPWLISKDLPLSGSRMLV